ncbi:MAG: hypothetical protein IH994_03235 [Proteobacteria bacterium]|nr:hypothetical protein [Pseudomonadota bacterium]
MIDMMTKLDSAINLHQRGDDVAAAGICEEMLAETPDNTDLHILLALIK